MREPPFPPSRASISRRTLVATALGAGTGAGAAPAAARQPGASEPRSLLEAILGRRTGENGYEEFLMAGDALKRSRLFEEEQRAESAALASRGSAPLALKRRVLEDPPVVRALALLRRGVVKPVRPPGPAVDTRNQANQYGPFRNLGRLLVIEQYVRLADGNVPAALESLRVALRFLYGIQRGNLLGGLVGTAAEAVVFISFGKHLDQLSARDCETLFRLCLEQLQLPDPLPGILEAQAQVDRERWPWLATLPPEELQRELRTSPPGALEDDPLADELVRLRFSAPEGFIAMLLEAQGLQADYFRRASAEVRKPVWARLPQELVPDPASLGQRLAARYTRYKDRLFTHHYPARTAYMRLLAVHAAVRRYRWEYDRLPESLAVLELGELVVDPFTGQPLRYERRGRGYRLTSPGGEIAPDSAFADRAVGGRLPVGITPEDRGVD